MASEILPAPTIQTIELVRNALGLDEKRVKEAVQHLKDWLELQPHLPNDFDEDRLEGLLIRCKNSLEKTKQSLDMYYTMRTIAPELLTNWNTNAEWFKSITKLIYVISLPELTPEGDRVTFVAFRDPDPTKFNCLHYFMLYLMNLQVRLKEDYWLSDIFILDYSKFGLGHVSKFSLPVLKKLEICAMKGFKCRVKAIHFIELPTAAEFLITWCKSIFKSKMMSRFQFHNKNMKSLYEHVPQRIFPEEYGGDAGKMEVLWDRWIKKYESYNEWFAEHEKLKSDESKRRGGKINSGDIFGFEGAFRKLEVD